MRRLLNHARRNAIAYLALFVALGGSSYAAISIPNGSITSAKLNKHSIGGYVLAWAHVRADGHVLSGSPGVVGGYVSGLAAASARRCTLSSSQRRPATIMMSGMTWMTPSAATAP